MNIIFFCVYLKRFYIRKMLQKSGCYPLEKYFVFYYVCMYFFGKTEIYCTDKWAIEVLKKLNFVIIK